MKKARSTLKNNLLDLIKDEIGNNKLIFNTEYNAEKNSRGPLNLAAKSKFIVSDWERLKFKILFDDIQILNKESFKQIEELYKRFKIINLQKELKVPIEEKSKNEILNYIYNNIHEIKNYLKS